MPATPIVGIAGKDRALLSARASTAPEPASFGPSAEVPQCAAAARRAADAAAARWTLAWRARSPLGLPY